MAIRNIELGSLMINKANDRHGELDNETAAVAWLFNAHEQHMKNLAKDIVAQGEIYEMPLVSPEGNKFIVFDGNRRVTCLKLLVDPKKAPTVELQDFFRELRGQWNGNFPDKQSCQVELDRNRIDDILFRRHTGTQGGVGQSTWTDRMKLNFVSRTGKGSGSKVADEIEKRLETAKLLPSSRKIPRSTLNRLLSSESLRNRLGFSMSRGKFEFTHSEDVSLTALARVANDLASREIVLGDLWDHDRKRAYIDRLEREGVLPTVRHSMTRTAEPKTTPLRTPQPPKLSPSLRTTLIPKIEHEVIWSAKLQRHKQIWEELQFHLELSKHRNAISVLMRVLIELSMEHYITEKGVSVFDQDKFANKLLKVGHHMFANGTITQKQLDALKKFQQNENIVSADTLNRYVHSADFAPSPEHLTAIWDTLSNIVVHCLRA